MGFGIHGARARLKAAFPESGALAYPVASFAFAFASNPPTLLAADVNTHILLANATGEQESAKYGSNSIIC